MWPKCVAGPNSLLVIVACSWSMVSNSAVGHVNEIVEWPALSMDASRIQRLVLDIQQPYYLAAWVSSRRNGPPLSSNARALHNYSCYSDAESI
eukprot:1629328-Amphidinium_carterae.1